MPSLSQECLSLEQGESRVNLVVVGVPPMVIGDWVPWYMVHIPFQCLSLEQGEIRVSTGVSWYNG